MKSTFLTLSLRKIILKLKQLISLLIMSEIRTRRLYSVS